MLSTTLRWESAQNTKVYDSLHCAAFPVYPRRDSYPAWLLIAIAQFFVPHYPYLVQRADTVKTLSEGPAMMTAS